MSIWGKIFGVSDDENKKNENTGSEKHDSQSKEMNKKSLGDLEEMVISSIRNATKVEVQEPSRPPEFSQLDSHFGGQPYFEQGEEWPTSKSGGNLEFIFQLFNGEGIELPEEIKLVQFFYDWEESPWETDNEGWLVKIYEHMETDKIKMVEKPDGQGISKYCGIELKPVKSLPDWEGISLYNEPAVELSCTLNPDEPWESYDSVVERLTGEQDYQSQLGGYPKWVQGEGTPKNEQGGNMRLLFQLDSEENAGLMWGDVGLIYVFYDSATKKVEFTLQCL
ncbi:DUF1963 domain-containing protein [Rufibacter tibetensis]|uniref:DUF1963 domain-containing protein n=1 Tax=Rufibacter tibetensis TaxID=512763 RepID=A0A0P0CT72_9BACT|nr:DUF1963 domain-containing protein [Rufibacter tibetensis]ALJ00714.1 hypothetical protein DC20_19195 [Rufibacter tibetensis]